jgi:hypothetical protein
MPLWCCNVCKAEASRDLQLQYCDGCQSALYCSEVCQKIDWKKQHKKICKLLNVGHGDMQVRSDVHTSRSIDWKELFETQEQTEHNQKFLLFHSLRFLIRSSDSEKLSWPNSPLLVLLQFVDPNVLSGADGLPLQEREVRATPLHYLTELADPIDYSTHENQLILAIQLIEHGANVNAVSITQGSTPLQYACNGDNVTNLDFVELLLKADADPNAEDHMGLTPLMCTIPDTSGAAKFLLNWPTTVVNTTPQSEASFLTVVKMVITDYTDEVTLPNNPDQVQHQFMLQQWHDIEEMLVNRGARDTGVSD